MKTSPKRKGVVAGGRRIASAARVHIVVGMRRGRWIWLMVATLAGTITLTVRAAGALPPLSRPEVRREIAAVVEKQLNAFRADDWDGAYACAATLFRVHVPRRSFETLIRRHYPLVWKNARFDVGLPRDDGERGGAGARVRCGPRERGV